MISFYLLLCYTNSMIFIQCALLAEASFLIENYQLSKSTDTHFTIYENDEIKLIISGIGKLEAAVATTYLLQRYNASKQDKIFNIGTCTSCKEAYNIGELFYIKKLIDFATQKVYHLGFKGEALTCVDRALSSCTAIKTPLADMESVGFYLSSRRFIKAEHIMIVKIISDKSDDTIPQKEQIKALFASHSKDLGALLR